MPGCESDLDPVTMQDLGCFALRYGANGDLSTNMDVGELHPVVNARARHFVHSYYAGMYIVNLLLDFQLGED
jgi:hypothetical protein